LASVKAESLYRATDRLSDDFVKPWQARAPKNFAMLLYGPPGTGKTSFAKLLAGALGWDLIQLSPSDFVRGGEAAVEEHAKAVFQVLEQMSTAVVLFDEIDRLLLDRDAKAYNTQGDVFQFMTPGMLTKINELGAKKRLIFIISTNYAERIDGAIKRSGRIDRQYLWLPPDAKRRRAILAMLIGRSAKEELARIDPSQKKEDLDKVADEIKEHAKRDVSSGYKKRMEELVARTTFWIFKEMEKVFEGLQLKKEVIEKLKDGDAGAFEEVSGSLLDTTTRVTPTIRLLSYKNRFRSTSGEKPRRFPYADEPYEEFLLLLFDAFCSGYEFTGQDQKELLKHFAKALQKQDLERVRDPEIRDKLEGELKKWGYRA
jgi:SpoVK/Ycf46/Vps4 family AAA+-type ATPase